MDATRSIRLPHWARICLYAAGLGLAWLVMSIAFGFGITSSHAADDEDRGVLGALVDTVDSVTDVLPDSLGEPVDEVVTAVEKTAKKTVETVTSTVDEVVDAKPVKKVTDAVTKTVKRVPVVGKVVDELGVTDVVDGVGDTVTEVVSGVDETVDTVVDTVVPAPTDPVATPEGPAGPTGPTTVPPAPAPSAGDKAGSSGALPSSPPTASPTTSTEHDVVSAPRRAVGADLIAPTAAVVSAVSPLRSDRDLPSSPQPPSSGPCASLASSTGFTGPTVGAGALPASSPRVAHHAWLRVLGGEAQNAPPAPPASPDVSPD